MGQNKKEVANALGDVILTAYILTRGQEEKMEIPLMIEVPVSWINLIKEFSSKDPFTTVELALREFFETGVVTFLKEMQTQYASSQEVLRKYEKLISK